MWCRSGHSVLEAPLQVWRAARQSKAEECSIRRSLRAASEQARMLQATKPRLASRAGSACLAPQNHAATYPAPTPKDSRRTDPASEAAIKANRI